MSLWEASFRYIIASYCSQNLQKLLKEANWEFCISEDDVVSLLVYLHADQVQEFVEEILGLTRGLQAMTTCKNIVIISDSLGKSQLIWPVALGDSVYNQPQQNPGNASSIDQGLRM